MTYKGITLGNGTRLATIHAPYWQSFAFGIFVGSGSRHESSTQNGIAHFTEHLLFKGTPSNTSLNIAVKADRVGASLNAYTSEEQTCYHVKALLKDIDSMLSLLNDIYNHSEFAPEEIDRERQVIEDEILLYEEQPSTHVDDLLSQAAWPNHPLGKRILGTPASLVTFDQTAFLHYTKEHYHAPNTVLTLASALPHEQMHDMLSPIAESLKTGLKPKEMCFLREHTDWQARFTAEDRNLQQTHLTLGFYCEGRHHPQFYATRLLSVLLGETMSSRLFQELREKRGLCYHCGTNRDAFSEIGLFTIEAAFDRKYLSTVLDVIIVELLRARNERPTPTLLQEAINYTVGQSLLALEDTSSQICWVGDASLNNEADLDPESYFRHLSQVTEEDILQAANALFRPENISIALLGHKASAKKAQVLEIISRL